MQELEALGLDRARTEVSVQALVPAFVRMYEPHEVREDTVVVPVLRDVLASKEFSERFPPD